MKTQIRNNRVNLLLINNIHREDKTGLTLSQWRSEHSVLETELFSSAAVRLGLEPQLPDGDVTLEHVDLPHLPPPPPPRLYRGKIQ